jgi:hypothetical protein
MAAAIIKAPAEFDCKTCKARHCDTDGKLPGSIGPAPFDQWVIKNPDGTPALSSPVCLLPMIDAATWYLFRIHKHYKNSVLLVAGGLLDQPSRYMHTMELIDEALASG